MHTNRLVFALFVILFLVASVASESFAGVKLYQGSWVAESFSNDKANIGSLESEFWEALAIPQGQNCHPNAPLCDFASTPVTTLGAGTLFHPLGPGCRPLTVGEPRPMKGDTLTPGGLACGIPPCDKTAPLYRNPAFFIQPGGTASPQACSDAQTVALGNTTQYLTLHDPKRGIAMKGAPLTGSASATTTSPGPAKAFNFPAALATPGPGNGMRFTGLGSFTGEGPYLYSYTYADLRNDAGDFGAGKGFFKVGAATNTLTFSNVVAGTTVATVTVKKGGSSFGGVMRLLGTYTTKVCYFYAGGCGLGYNDWRYDVIGASAYKDSKAGSPVVTASYTTSNTFTYYNTALNSIAKYVLVAQRFPWTTGDVLVSATGRGANNTVVNRKGFDKRTASGVGTVQLVSPILTQWLAQLGNAPKLETGGVAIMQIKFVPEPGGIASMVAGLSMLLVLFRLRS